MTINGRWRLHQPREYRSRKFGAMPELYDLGVDPDERSHVDDPERIADMQARIAAFRERHALGEEAISQITAEQKELMNALGYTGD